MPAVPNQRDWTRGELATAAEMNTEMANPITFYRQRPMFFGQFDTTLTSIASSTTYAAIAWGGSTQFVDSEGMVAPGSTNIICVRPGLYSLQAQMIWSANTAGVRAGKIGVVRTSTGVFSTVQETGAASSGSSSFLKGGGTPSVETTVRLHDPGLYLDAGDYIQFLYYQNSGSALSLLGTPNGGLTWAMVRWVAAS